MARSNGHKIELTAYDDLFQTDESRAEAKLSKIRDIPIAEIDEFPDHPFKVLPDEDMEQLVESIKRNGVMTPATVVEQLIATGVDPETAEVDACRIEHVISNESFERLKKAAFRNQENEISALSNEINDNPTE